jgi:hypothetical protein
MIDSLLLKSSMVVLQNNLLLRPKENLLIVADGGVETRLPEALGCAGVAVGAEVQTMYYSPRRYTHERDFCRFGGAWQLEDILSPVVGAAMKTADCVVFVNSDMDVFFSGFLREALTEGTRIILLCYIVDRDRFLRLMPETPEEVLQVKETTEKYFELMRAARHARLTSPAGTDIEVALGDHRAGCSTGVVGSEEGGFVGGMELLPAGQVIRCPNKGSANGRIVLNRSVMAHEYTKLLEPIELKVKDGYVVEIGGDIEAERLKAFLSGWNDPEIYNVTELGIGTNPRCRFAGLCAPAEDTHTWGMATLAFGNDTHLGGATKAPCHIDSTMWQPSLELDGKPVVARGKLVL